VPWKIKSSKLKVSVHVHYDPVLVPRQLLILPEVDGELASWNFGKFAVDVAKRVFRKDTPPMPFVTVDPVATAPKAKAKAKGKPWEGKSSTFSLPDFWPQMPCTYAPVRCALYLQIRYYIRTKPAV
jgi:hypothetical protein